MSDTVIKKGSDPSEVIESGTILILVNINGTFYMPMGVQNSQADGWGTYANRVTRHCLVGSGKAKHLDDKRFIEACLLKLDQDHLVDRSTPLSQVLDDLGIEMESGESAALREFQEETYGLLTVVKPTRWTSSTGGYIVKQTGERARITVGFVVNPPELKTFQDCSQLRQGFLAKYDEATWKHYMRNPTNEEHRPEHSAIVFVDVAKLITDINNMKGPKDQEKGFVFAHPCETYTFGALSTWAYRLLSKSEVQNALKEIFAEEGVNKSSM